MDIVSWSAFGESFAAEAAFSAALPIEAWGCYKADTPAPCTLSAEIALRRFAELPAGPVESEWSIVLDLTDGVRLEDSDDGFYSADDYLATSEVIRRIEASQALQSDLTWDLGI